LLGIAYAASIGGVATIVGTPPNTFMAGFLKQKGIEVGFAQWMSFALPLSIVFLLLAWWLMTHVLFPVRVREIPGSRELIAGELAKLGPLSRGELAVLAVFVLTAVSWIARGWIAKLDWIEENAEWFLRIDDTMIALAAAISLFLIPVDWRSGTAAMNWEAARRLPYDILLLFGGGLSLAAAVADTQLADWICQAVIPTEHALPSTILLILLVTAVVVFLTELTSNLATVAIFLPLLFTAAGQIPLDGSVGVDPMLLIIPAALAASCAFMLPVATPPNAVVYGSGKLRIGQMIRAGFWLNLVSISLITLLVYFVAPLVFGVR